MEHRDRLWPGGYTFLYDDGLFRPSTDTFLLGSFPRLRRGTTVCELGAGTGLLSLLLLAREPELTVTGVELQPQACALFRRTAEENGLQGRMHCLEGDLRQGLLPPGRFRLAVANPPYFPPGAGAVAPDAARRTARAETDCTLSQLCAAAARALTWGGSFCLVHRRRAPHGGVPTGGVSAGGPAGRRRGPHRGAAPAAAWPRRRRNRGRPPGVFSRQGGMNHGRNPISGGHAHRQPG